MPDILFFREVKEEDYPVIGEKAKKLALLSQAGFKVPPGFIIKADVMSKLISRRDIQTSIQELYKNPENWNNVQKLVKSIEFPDDIADEIIDAYLSLSVSLDKPTAASLLSSEEVFVAVRNSSSINLPKQKTILNIKGKEKLFKAILECYADNFGPEIMEKNNENNSGAIIIQRMVDAEKSGSAFTNNKDIIITACFGLGEGLESEVVFPDTYVIDKNTSVLKGINVGEKNYAYIRDIDTEATIKQELGEKSKQQVLEEKEITEISSLLKKTANLFGKEQKFEWSIKRDVVYILQAKDNVNEQKESVEFEITENEEPQPEKIDIMPEEEEFISEPEEVKSEDIEFVHLDSIDQEEQKEPEEIAVKEPIEEKEDDSIFSSYKDFEKKDLGISRISEIAKLNAGNTLVYCHIAVKEKLKHRLLKHVNETSDDFTEILDELILHESLDDELAYRKLDKAAKDFMLKLKYPEPETVMIGLRMVEG